MEDFLKKLKLNKIDSFYYKKTLGGGKASLTLLYENNEGNKIVIKFLIVPRNNEELKRFKEEVSALQIIEKKRKKFNKNKHTSGVVCAPQILSDLIHFKPYPIYYYKMEYIDGITIDQLFNKKPLPWNWELNLEIILRITIALGETLGFIVHRDLHPGNIIITKKIDYDSFVFKDPGIRIMDFGCNKDMLRYFSGLWYEDKFRHLGAISTWSPEFIYDPESVTGKHDSWAIGVLFYRLLTNEYPIYAESFGDLINKYKNQDINWEKIDLLNIPIAIKLLLKRILCFDINERLKVNEIGDICWKLLFTDILERDNNFISMFIDNEGVVDCCSRCGILVGNQSRCNNCGLILESENCLPALGNKKNFKWKPFTIN